MAKKVPAGPGGHYCAVATQALASAIKSKSKERALVALKKVPKCRKSMRTAHLRKLAKKAKKMLVAGF